MTRTRSFCFRSIFSLLGGFGLAAALLAWLQTGTALRLPAWLYIALLAALALAALGYGVLLHPRRASLALLAAGILGLAIGIPVLAGAYTGPGNRTTTTTTQVEDYGTWHLTDTAPPPECPGVTSCDLQTSSCSNPPSVQQQTYYCCDGTTNSYWSANQPDSCTPHYTTVTTTVTENPAAVTINSENCAKPGANGWCRGGAALTLSASEPWSPPYVISDIFSDLGELCPGNGTNTLGNCVWSFPQGDIPAFNLWADSSFGDTSVFATTSEMKLDSVPPVLTLSIPAPNGQNGWFTSGPVTASVSATDATSGLSGTPSINGGGDSFTAIADGKYALTATVSDLAGNTASASGKIWLDTTPPVAGFSIPAPDGQNGWHKTAFTVTPNGADATSGIASQQVSLDQSNWSSSLNISTDGVTTVYSQAKDNASNLSSITSTTVSLDTTPPTMSVTLPLTSTGWYTTQPAVSVTANDATSGVASIDYSLDGGPYQPSLATMSDGVHSFTVQGTDRAGNSVTSGPYTVKVDTIPPQSVFVSPAEGSTAVAIGNHFVMTGTTSDATSGVAGAQISLNDGSSWAPLGVTNGSWAYVWDTGKVPDGNYQVLVSGTDVAGNLEHTAHITVTVGNNGPTVSITKNWVIWQTAAIKISAGTLPVTGGQITISNSINGNTVQSFDYTSMPPTSFKWNGLTSKGASAPFGVYTVRVEIWDGYGQHANDSGTVWLPAPQPKATSTPTSTSTPAATATAGRPAAQPTGTALPPSPVPSPTPIPAVVPIPKPPAPTPVAKPVEATWPAAFTGSLVVLFLSLSLLDPRPAAWRRLARIKNQKS